MIAVGAGEIADPLADLTAKYDKVIWYCNCGGGFAEQPNLIQSGDDGSEIGFSAGYATGLLMKAKGVTKAAMIGNNSFNFEKESFGAFRLGLDQVDPSYEWTYVATGSFNDVAAATEAFNNLKAQGVGAIYPYLGGSHEAVVKLSNENDVITMSAGAANACERTDLTYQIAVKFDAGQYVATILDEIQSGKLQRGRDPGLPRRRRRQRRRGRSASRRRSRRPRWRTCWPRSPPATSRPSSTRTARRRTPLERSGQRGRRRPTAPPRGPASPRCASTASASATAGSWRATAST